MALSNWDTLAFDAEGKPCSGTLKLNRGSAKAEIYKNWIYVRDGKAHHEDSHFTDETIMQIDSGRIHYGDAEISVWRHKKQSACFIFVKRFYKPDDSEEWVREYSGGIGCSGYLDYVEYALQFNPEWASKIPFERCKKAWYCGDYSRYGPDGTWWGITIVDDKERGHDEMVLGEGDGPDTYVGVLDSTYASFVHWLEREAKDDQKALEWLKKVKASKPARFNQGDAFFVGVEEAMTPLDEKKEPILMQTFKSPPADVYSGMSDEDFKNLQATDGAKQFRAALEESSS